jgi:hypothetical protein
VEEEGRKREMNGRKGGNIEDSGRRGKKDRTQWKKRDEREKVVEEEG